MLRFDVYMIEAGTDNDGAATPPPVEVMETLDVSSWERWRRVLGSDAMPLVRDAFDRVADTSTVQMWRASAV